MMISSCDKLLGEDDGVDCIIFDSIHQLDGLERLIVIPVGLDAAIEASPGLQPIPVPTQAAASGASPPPPPPPPASSCDSLEMQTRSRLYRAVTRAHLMIVIVNHFVKGTTASLHLRMSGRGHLRSSPCLWCGLNLLTHPVVCVWSLHQGGWLEFLGHVRLASEEAFDRNTELARADSAAADDMVLSDVAAAIEAADATLAPGVVAVLTPRVTQVCKFVRHDAACGFSSCLPQS